MVSLDTYNVTQATTLINGKRAKYPEMIENSGVTVAGLNGLTATLLRSKYIIVGNNLIWVSIAVQLTNGNFQPNVSSNLFTMTVAGRNPYAYNSFPTVDENNIAWTLKCNGTSGTMYGSPTASTGSSTSRILLISGLIMVG